MRKLTVIMVLILGLLLMACNAVIEPEPTADPGSTMPETERNLTPVVVEEEETPEMSRPDIPEESEPMVERVRLDLAARLDVEREAVGVVKVEGVDWADSSLGCPEPDMMYLMVITPGYYIVLEAGGEQYDYHTDQRSHFVFCRDGQGEPPIRATQ
jgi:hypothetical protein